MARSDHLDELHDLIHRHHRAEPPSGGPERLLLTCGTASEEPVVETYRPLLCLIVRGAKRLVVGRRAFRFEPGDHFVNGQDRPVTGWVESAGYASATLELDLGVLGDVITDRGGDATSRVDEDGMCCDRSTPAVLDAAVRLLGLLDAPKDLRVLWPLYERELLYRVLDGPCGETLRDATFGFNATASIRPVVAWIRDHLDQPLELEALAAAAAMSLPSLRRHFEAATGTTPLRFQKALRLQEARRLLLIGGSTAASTAYAVGYASASQFSREYAAYFGEPPRRNTSRRPKALPEELDPPPGENGAVEDAATAEHA